MFLTFFVTCLFLIKWVQALKEILKKDKSITGTWSCSLLLPIETDYIRISKFQEISKNANFK